MPTCGDDSGQHIIGVEAFVPFVRRVARFSEGIAPPRPEFSAPLVFPDPSFSDERQEAKRLSAIHSRKSANLAENMILHTCPKGCRSRINTHMINISNFEKRVLTEIDLLRLLKNLKANGVPPGLWLIGLLQLTNNPLSNNSYDFFAGVARVWLGETFTPCRIEHTFHSPCFAIFAISHIPTQPTRANRR